MVTKRPVPEPSARRGPALRVVLAEENALLRRSLRRLLENLDGVTVVGESADLPGVKDELRLTTPDVVVVDLRLAGGDVLGFIRAQAASEHPVRVVAMTMSSNSFLAAQALGAGAEAVVIKDRADEQLAAAFEAAA